MNPWNINQDSFTKEKNQQYESLFSLGNGYMGVRGCLVFTEDRCSPGVFINGFHETAPIQYGEAAFGFARNNQTIVALPDWTELKLAVDDQPLLKQHIKQESRVLRLDQGILEHRIEAEVKDIQLQIIIKRSIFMTEKNLGMQEISLSSSRLCTLMVQGSIRQQQKIERNTDDPRTGSELSHYRPDFIKGQTNHDSFTLEYQTKGSHKILCCGLKAICSSDAKAKLSIKDESGFITLMQQTDQMEITFVACYSDGYPILEQKTFDFCRTSLKKTDRAKLLVLKKDQDKYYKDFWKSASIEIETTFKIQQAVLFNIFHIFQSSGTDGKTSIAAKGLSGAGYEGHYFWDAEIYILPMLIYTKPNYARKMLEYRYNTLEKARDRAKELSHKGALYPWRTISGEEASAYFPAGTAQYHINADIAFGISKYIDLTKDMDFLCRFGLEILVETARFWADFIDDIPGKGGCINGVTGPDEYTALVNNNLYTNLMASTNLSAATKYCKLTKKDFPQAFDTLKEKIDLSEEEIEEWNKLTSSIYIPYDEKTRINPQNDNFFDQALWDFESTPKENYPLLLNYHPLNIYRYQVLKQADVVMAMFLHDQEFSHAQKIRNYGYYEPITTGDSSLSACAEGIVASHLGYKERAHKMFYKTALVDLEDLNGNVKDGLHTASMGGSWLAIVYGFAGLKEGSEIMDANKNKKEDRLSFFPDLPHEIKSLVFSLWYRQRKIKIFISHTSITAELQEGSPIFINLNTSEFLLENHKKAEISLIPHLTMIITDSIDQFSPVVIEELKKRSITLKQIKSNDDNLKSETESLLKYHSIVCTKNQRLEQKALCQGILVYHPIKRIEEIEAINKELLEQQETGLFFVNTLEDCKTILKKRGTYNE